MKPSIVSGKVNDVIAVILGEINNLNAIVGPKDLLCHY